ncbi:MAG: LCP family protein [Lachnospiraceae bacterium]
MTGKEKNHMSFEDDEIDFEQLIMEQTNLEEKQYDRRKQIQQQGRAEQNRRSQEPSRRSPQNLPPQNQKGRNAQRDSGFRQMGAKKKKRKRVVRTILLVISLIILAVIAFAASKLSKVDRIKLDNLETNDLSAGTIEKLSGYTTLALFGLDNRSNGNFESGNSDTIILASINNKTKEIKLASVYRDTYLDVGNDTFSKCNAAYQKGGPQQAINMLNRNLDLDIAGYVAVDWNALVKTIDLLGGVDIDLTEEEARLTQGYIDEISEQTGVQTTYPSAGPQTLDGVQATSYARIRYTAGWDYKRTERQRIVVNQIFEKAKSTNVMTLNKIIDEVFPMISTSLSNKEILSLASHIASYSMGDNTGFPFEKASDAAKDYIVIPVNLDNNVAELHKFLYNEESYTVSTQVQALSDTIVNNLGQWQAE